MDPCGTTRNESDTKADPFATVQHTCNIAEQALTFLEKKWQTHSEARGSESTKGGQPMEDLGQSSNPVQGGQSRETLDEALQRWTASSDALLDALEACPMTRDSMRYKRRKSHPNLPVNLDTDGMKACSNTHGKLTALKDNLQLAPSGPHTAQTTKNEPSTELPKSVVDFQEANDTLKRLVEYKREIFHIFNPESVSRNRIDFAARWYFGYTVKELLQSDGCEDPAASSATSGGA